MATHPIDPTGRSAPGEGPDGPILAQIFELVREVRDRLAGTQKDLMTVDEVAQLTGRTPYTVRRWVAEGRIRATRVAGTGPKGRLLVPRVELRKLIGQGLGDALPPDPVQ